LAEVARNRAAAIFGRQELHTLVEHLRKAMPVIVKDIGTDVLPLATLHKAMQILLRERVWPRDAIAMLDAMLEVAGTTRDPRDLAEAARKVLVGPLLRRRNVSELNVLMFDPEFERRVSAAWNVDADAIPDPRLAVHIRERVEAYRHTVPHAKATIICTSGFRRTLRELLERFSIFIDVFAFGEIPPDIQVRPVSVVSAPGAQLEGERQTALAG
jgi:flagellar biosynthesis protein FlhA